MCGAEAGRAHRAPGVDGQLEGLALVTDVGQAASAQARRARATARRSICANCARVSLGGRLPRVERRGSRSRGGDPRWRGRVRSTDPPSAGRRREASRAPRRGCRRGYPPPHRRRRASNSRGSIPRSTLITLNARVISASATRRCRGDVLGPRLGFSPSAARSLLGVLAVAPPHRRAPCRRRDSRGRDWRR